MAEPARLTVPELMTAAGRGLWKVDALGPRGATLVSLEEIVAMAGVLAMAGLTPLAPGEAFATAPVTEPPKGDADV